MAAKERKIGDVESIGGIRLVCVPDWLITYVGMAPGTAGILLPPEAAGPLVDAMRLAGVVSAPAPQPTPAKEGP